MEMTSLVQTLHRTGDDSAPTTTPQDPFPRRPRSIICSTHRTVNRANRVQSTRRGRNRSQDRERRAIERSSAPSRGVFNSPLEVDFCFRHRRGEGFQPYRRDINSKFFRLRHLVPSRASNRTAPQFVPSSRPVVAPGTRYHFFSRLAMCRAAISLPSAFQCASRA